MDNHKIPKYINEFWTAKQRQANSLHEISYRACFKPQLPNFFIKLFTKEKEVVYDPYIVQYAEDNWLRCWFNDIDVEKVAQKITMSKRLGEWSEVMSDVFKEFYRITKPSGYVAF